VTQEILYTSAPKGLKPGSRGFCTVVSSEGMARNLAERLEALSGYRHAFGVHDENRNQNPINWSHTAMRIGGQEWHVLSRIADAGQDYSGRTNKLAHHIALDRNERPACGPARILQTSGVITAEWNEQVEIIPCRRLPSIAEPNTANCPAWKRWAGDAGWAGQVAEYVSSQTSPASVIFPAGCPDTLELVSEVLDLLPPEKRWQVTFSTYFTQLVPGTECRLRFVLDGTSEASSLRNHPHAFVVDLCSQLTEATGGDLVAAARSGALPFNGSASRTPPVDEGEIEDEVTFASADDVAVSTSKTQAKQSSDHDGEGSYGLQTSESHEDAYGRPNRPPDVRGRRVTRSNSTGRRKIALIVSGILAGTALLVVAFVFVFQMGRQSVSPEIPPGDSLAALDHVAGSQPQGHGQHSTSGTDKGTKDGVETDTANASGESTANPTDSDSANGSKQNSSQEKDEEAGNAEIANQNKPPDNDSNDASAETATDASKTMRNDRKPAGSPAGNTVASAEGTSVGKKSPKETPRVEVEPDPFAELPRTKDGSMYEVLLPELGAPVTVNKWQILTREKLKLELPGAGILVAASDGSQTDDKQSSTSEIKLVNESNIWKVQRFKLGNLGNQETETLGKFTVSADRDRQMLQFDWNDPMPSETGQLLRWAILKISAGKHVAICRLGRPVAAVTLKLLFNDKTKDIESPISFPMPREVPASLFSRINFGLGTLSSFPTVTPAISTRSPEIQIFHLPVLASDRDLDLKVDPYVELQIRITAPATPADALEVDLSARLAPNRYSDDFFEAFYKDIVRLSELQQRALMPPYNHNERIRFADIGKQLQPKKAEKVQETLNNELRTARNFLSKLKQDIQNAEKNGKGEQKPISNEESPRSREQIEEDLKKAERLIETLEMQLQLHSTASFGKLKMQAEGVIEKLKSSDLVFRPVFELRERDGGNSYRVIVAEDGGATE
jgi:hypothetical protein